MKMSKSIKLKMIEYRRKNSAEVNARLVPVNISPDQLKVGLELIRKLKNLVEF